MTSTDQVPRFMAVSPFIESDGLSHTKHVDTIRNRRLRVLLIDDTDRFRESMTFILTEKYGAVVTEVKSGRDAVALLKAGNAFNVIFLDLIMPDMNGIETFEELRQAGVACRMIMMSAHPDSKEWEKAEELGMELIEKPFEPAALTAILSEL